MFVLFLSTTLAWHVCDVTRAPYNASGDGVTKDTLALRAALEDCDEVLLPASRTFLTGPVNLTSNQVLVVDGTLLASVDTHDYALVAPLMSYGWGNDENCFPPDADKYKIIVGSRRYAPIVGAFDASNVTISGSGVIDGQGASWWDNCTRCHYPPNNDSSFCEIASRPKLIETQFVDGLRVIGGSASRAGLLTLQNSPFWTLTPSYSQDIHVANLRILAPVDRIGNTDGVNLDSCRNALVENVEIQNSDDGVCIKSGLNGFGLNLAIPTENVVVRNISCPAGGRGGFAIGSEMSGGVRNVTYRDSTLAGERGINIKPSVGRGGYIHELRFENVVTPSVSFSVGHDGASLMPGNDYVPLVSNVHFSNVTMAAQQAFGACKMVNRSKCFNLTVDGAPHGGWSERLPPQTFACKTWARTMWGDVKLPWGVCLPMDAPVNLQPEYSNWGEATGRYTTLEACKRECVVAPPGQRRGRPRSGPRRGPRVRV
mgnify:CR=1 FL=1